MFFIHRMRRSLTRLFPQAVINSRKLNFCIVNCRDLTPQQGNLSVKIMEAQVVQAFKNVKTILEDAGSSMDKVVKITVFMVAGHDPDFSITNKVYPTFSRRF